MRQLIEHKTQQLRSKRGSGLVLMALSVLLAVFTIGALGLDIAHNTTSRTSLQDATDAAALAGAAAIVQNSINPNNGFASSNDNWQSPYLQYNDGAIETAVQNAVVNSAANNYSDGHTLTKANGVSLSSPSPANNFYVSNPYTNKDIPGNNGQCLVRATESIKNLFAGIIGRPTENVDTISRASAYTTVTGVHPNTLFPIAVSVDTIVGHSGMGNNYPLNSSSSIVSNPNALDPKSLVTFSLEDPCANAAWTTFNTLSTTGGPLVDGKTSADMDKSATDYINKALLPSVLGTAFNIFSPINPGSSGPPAQFVGEQSSTGGVAYTADSGIDLWGALAGAGNGFTKNMEGSTIILPIVAGDQPFWNLDVNNLGTPYAPGARQTRPLIGFCAVKVTKTLWDSSNNCLQGFKGYLVKALVKGTPGLVDPYVNPTKNGAADRNAALMAALANLSPGMVQLGDTSFHVAPSKFAGGNQVPLNSWYQGHVAPGNNTIMEATLDPGNQTIQPIASNFPRMMSDDMKALCGGVKFNETQNWTGSNPPFTANGVGMLNYCKNGDGTNQTLYDQYSAVQAIDTELPFAQVLLNPLSQLITITGSYTDEHTSYTDIGLNSGYDINNSWQSAGADPKTAPRYIVVDTAGSVMQQPGYSSTLTDMASWPPLTIGPDTNGGQGHQFSVNLTINPSSLNNGTGEYLVILHAFDTDLGHGGWAGGGDPSAPGTPPGGINGQGQLWYGDPAFYYIDIQFPQCPTL